MRNSPLTLRLVLYIYRAQLSRRVSLAECRVRASYRSAGPCHLLSTPAALTTPRRSRSRCDGLPQFNEDTGGPSCTLPENNTSELTLSYKTKNTLSIRNTKGESCSDVCWPLPGTSFTNQDTSLDLPQMFSSTSQHCPSSTRTAGVRQHPHQHVESWSQHERRNVTSSSIQRSFTHCSIQHTPVDTQLCCSHHSTSSTHKLTRNWRYKGHSSR